MELLTYAEAAELAEISAKTIQRHILKGKLATVETPFGKRILREAMVPYLDLLRQGKTPVDTQDKTAKDTSGQVRTVKERPAETREDSLRQDRTSSDSVPLAAHLAALELAGSQLNRMAEQLDQERRRVDVAERGRFALEAQLAQYQRALAENAETLAEARAKVLETEAKSLAETQVKESVMEAKGAAPKSLWSRFRRALQGQEKTG